MHPCPRTQLPVLRMTPVPQHGEQVFIPPYSTAVLGRTGTPPIQTAWNDVKFRPRPEVFESHEMLPAVAEIVLIHPAGSLFAGNVTEANPSVTLHVGVLLRVQLPVACRADDELVQVGMFPP